MQQPIKTEAQSSQKGPSDRRFSYYSFITEFYSLFLKANLKYISSKLGFEFQWPRNNCCLFPFSFSGASKIFGICLKAGLPLGLCKEWVGKPLGKQSSSWLTPPPSGLGPVAGDARSPGKWGMEGLLLMQNLSACKRSSS